MLKKYLPLIDANFNRCKEGLRVAEDIFRFLLQDDRGRNRARKYRHQLVKTIQPDLIKKAILERDSRKDLGKKLDAFEAGRKDLWDILYRNLQRSKESLRVLEEFSKITNKKSTAKIKNLRYSIYDFEKEIILKWPTLYSRRRKSRR